MEQSTPNQINPKDSSSTDKNSLKNLKPPSFFTKFKESVSSFVLIGTAILLAWAMITFVFQTYVVDGPSMQPTLANNDRLIVVKLGQTFASLQSRDFVPDRYSVIVFSRLGATDSSGEIDKQLIKRVVGLPGDRIVIKNGQVTIFNSNNPNGFDPDATNEYGTSTNVTTGNVDITVSEGEVFVLGDNRSNSLDSRAFGTIDSENIIGELKLRILPLNQSRSF